MLNPVSPLRILPQQRELRAVPLQAARRALACVSGRRLPIRPSSGGHRGERQGLQPLRATVAKVTGQRCNAANVEGRLLLKSLQGAVFVHPIPDPPRGQEMGYRPFNPCIVRGNLHVHPGSRPAVSMRQS